MVKNKILDQIIQSISAKFYFSSSRIPLQLRLIHTPKSHAKSIQLVSLDLTEQIIHSKIWNSR